MDSREIMRVLRINNENMETESTGNAIPENSGTALIDETTSRFSSAIWYDKVRTKSVLLAGVGGIGSYVGFLLARMKIQALIIYDPDIVEIANMSGQLYGIRDIGELKVDALSSTLRSYADYYGVYSVGERFTNESAGSDIMICGFDNMEARKTFFTNWVSHVAGLPEVRKKECLFIDGRLAAEELQVLCIKGDDEYNMNRYKKEFLFNDEEADSTICSYKQTSYMANMIGSIITNLFVNFVANECNPLISRDLPFLTTYSAETMYFKTIA